jgi:hypothetical protein
MVDPAPEDIPARARHSIGVELEPWALASQGLGGRQKMHPLSKIATATLSCVTSWPRPVVEMSFWKLPLVCMNCAPIVIEAGEV